MAPPRKPGVLDPLRSRVRRLQFVVGMGFMAFVVGAVFSSALIMRLQPRLQALGSPLVAFLLMLLVKRLWLLAVLPAFCYGAGRILELRPWSTAIGAAVTGEGFVLALALISKGSEGLWDLGLDDGVHLAALVAGVLLSRWAVGKGRAAAGKAQQEAASAAQAKGSQYAEFAAEAERLASRREANPIAPTAGAAEGSAAAPTTAGAEGSPAASATTGTEASAAASTPSAAAAPEGSPATPATTGAETSPAASTPSDAAAASSLPETAAPLAAEKKTG